MLMGLAAVAIVLILFTVLGIWWIHDGVFRSDRFNAQSWSRPRTNAEDSTCYRGGMAADIKNRLVTPSMTNVDVERLLGQPDGVSNPREYQYILGMCSGFRMDYDILHIYFNQAGRVERAKIIQH